MKKEGEGEKRKTEGGSIERDRGKKKEGREKDGGVKKDEKM